MKRIINRWVRGLLDVHIHTFTKTIFTESEFDLRIANFSSFLVRAIPVTGHEDVRLPHFLENRLTGGGEVVSLIRQPPFTPQEDFWYSFLLEAEWTPGP
jgi:hypothetical protein